MRRFVLLVLFVAGCSSEIGTPLKRTADARPIGFNVPPEPKEGSGTAPGCNGVTTNGECQQNVAVSCDIGRNALRRIDCTAQGKNCIREVGTGSACLSLDPDPNGANSPCTNTNISEQGYCTSDDVAVFCDTSATPITRTWNCKNQGKTCNNCPAGERCCGGDEPMGASCGAIDFEGICEGETLRFCNDGILLVRDCAADGQVCNDTCALGNFCCGEPNEPDECAIIGVEGVCNADNMGDRFCVNGDIIERSCDPGQTCMVDACGFGAACCDSSTPPTNRCTELGPDGACTVNGEVEYCLGTEEADIIVLDCPANGQFCQAPGIGCSETVASCCDLPKPG